MLTNCRPRTMVKSELKKTLKAALAEMVSEAWETEDDLAALATTSVAVKWSTNIPATPINATPRLEDGKAEAAETWAGSSYQINDGATAAITATENTDKVHTKSKKATNGQPTTLRKQWNQ